jgi:hypothetical protein
LDTVLKTEEFPAGVTDLDTTLADMDANTLTHLLRVEFFKVKED